MQCLPVLPIEVVNNILEINGGLIHKENMISNLKNIPLKAVHTKVNNIINGYEKDGIYYNGDFQHYMNLTLSYYEKEHLIKLLSTCNCCIRHNTRKPTLKQFYEGTYISTDLNTTTHTSDICNCNCNCNCRHIMRWICRTTSHFELDNDNDEIFNEVINQQMG